MLQIQLGLHGCAYPQVKQVRKAKWLYSSSIHRFVGYIRYPRDDDRVACLHPQSDSESNAVRGNRHFNWREVIYFVFIVYWSCFKYIFFVWTSTNIIIKRSFTEKLGTPYSNCVADLTTINSYDSELYRLIFASNYSYRQQDCIDLCFNEQIVVSFIQVLHIYKYFGLYCIPLSITARQPANVLIKASRQAT